jgi:hypothetical protein
MSDADDKTPADPRDLAAAIAFSPQFEGRKRVHHAEEWPPSPPSASCATLSARASSSWTRGLRRHEEAAARQPALGGGFKG